MNDRRQETHEPERPITEVYWKTTEETVIVTKSPSGEVLNERRGPMTGPEIVRHAVADMRKHGSGITGDFNGTRAYLLQFIRETGGDAHPTRKIERRLNRNREDGAHLYRLDTIREPRADGPWCCSPGCENAPVYEATYEGGREGSHIHACESHLGHLLGPVAGDAEPSHYTVTRLHD